MFDTGKNLPSRSRVTRILHLDRHCHVFCIVQSDQQLFLVQAGKRASVATGDLGARIFSGELSFRVRRRTPDKDKGCDIGYALAASSCEGAKSVERISCAESVRKALLAHTSPNGCNACAASDFPCGKETISAQ